MASGMGLVLAAAALHDEHVLVTDRGFCDGQHLDFYSPGRDD